MFPNIRLMIVAVLASVVGMSCGVGVLAAFRSSHEPLARLPASASPQQLVFDNAARAAAADLATAPFGVRFEVDAPRNVLVAAPDVSAPPPPADTAGPSEAKTDAIIDAAVEPVADLSLPAELTTPEIRSAPAVATPAAAKPEAAKHDAHTVSKRQHTAQVHRSRKARARAAPAAEQNAGFSQSNFQSGPDAAQYQPARAGRAASR